MHAVASTMKERWIVLLFISNAWSGDWGVMFKDQCALEGTTLRIACKYDYPFGHIVTSAAWFKGQRRSGQWVLYSLPSLPTSASSQVHFEYVGTYRGDCSLKINNLKRSDEGFYFFRFVTTLSSWTSKRPLYLSVKELTAVLEPSTVTEGQRVSLSCETGCATQLQTVWYRDGKLVPNPVFWARKNNSGNYYCTVLGRKSASVALNVQYAPNNVVFSMKPAGHVLNGSAVTLSCSSDANPPVPQGGYSLFKDKQLISSGPSYTISFPQPSHSGLYHCQASNNISRRGNTYVNSPEVNLDVQYLPSVAGGSSVNIACSSAANPANRSFIWYKWSSPSSLLQVGSGQVLSLPSTNGSHTGIYLCQVKNLLGVTNSTKVLLAMEENNSGHQALLILAGFGVCLLGSLVIALLLLWTKHRREHEKRVPLHSQYVSHADAEDQSNSVYANVNISTPSPQPPPRRYSKQQHANVMHQYGHVKTRRHRSQQARNGRFSNSIDKHDEVTYSTVTIQAKNPQESRFKMGENDTTIYSVVANSR
uniref:B-cell receptor CD22-like isoform X3 n=1 Tax=Doryrhamphus excisus TaxID=161450 RepID=UPI0025ADB0B6|nr:B-cell receptor CD22-like isoform X3 [Doryrhamphus excisus]